MRLPEVYVAWMSDRLFLVVDVWEETHLEDTLTEGCGLTNRTCRDRCFFLPVEIFEDGEVDVHLVNLVAVQTDLVIRDDLLSVS